MVVTTWSELSHLRWKMARRNTNAGACLEPLISSSALLETHSLTVKPGGRPVFLNSTLLELFIKNIFIVQRLEYKGKPNKSPCLKLKRKSC